MVSWSNGRQRREVDHLAADLLLQQLVRGAQGFVGHCAPGDQRDVVALAQHLGLVQRQGLAVVQHILPGHAIQPRGFEEDHRIRITDGRQQQSIGARG